MKRTIIHQKNNVEYVFEITGLYSFDVVESCKLIKPYCIKDYDFCIICQNQEVYENVVKFVSENFTTHFSSNYNDYVNYVRRYKKCDNGKRVLLHFEINDFRRKTYDGFFEFLKKVDEFLSK